jgi:type II secretory pathway component PulF
MRDLIERLRRLKIRTTGNDQEAAKIFNEAIDVIESFHQKERPFARQLAMLLDASIPALEKAARAERRREDGKSLRCITDQERLKAVEEAVAKADELFGSIA